MFVSDHLNILECVLLAIALLYIGQACFIGGHDLVLRRQIGVVPQDVQLNPEDLWDNVVGDRSDISNEDVWQQLELQALRMSLHQCPWEW